jgi:hypothetical protein
MRKALMIFCCIIVFLSFVFCDRIKFEYYTFNLSSEDYIVREENAEKIVKMGKMGNIAIPMIIDKLDNPYIYETDYLVDCIGEITQIKVNHRAHDSIINFWLNCNDENNSD